MTHDDELALIREQLVRIADALVEENRLLTELLSLTQQFSGKSLQNDVEGGEFWIEMKMYLSHRLEEIERRLESSGLIQPKKPGGTVQ